jgi:hypothetical protein
VPLFRATFISPTLWGRQQRQCRAYGASDYFSCFLSHPFRSGLTSDAPMALKCDVKMFYHTQVIESFGFLYDVGSRTSLNCNLCDPVEILGLVASAAEKSRRDPFGRLRVNCRRYDNIACGHRVSKARRFLPE